MRNTSLFFILILFSLVPLTGVAQNKIDYKSDRTIKNEEKYPGAFIMSKVNNQVYFKHEGIEVWCDLAIFYKKENFFKAFGHVKMVQGDSITMTSKYAEYNGNTKFAFASSSVHLRTPNNALSTDTLFFNRKKQEAFYRSGGVLRDSSSTITSSIGRYYIKENRYSFISNVVVSNPQYTIETNQLDFYNKTGHAYMYGPTTITGDKSTIYCERGFYDTRGDTGYFVKNSTIYYENRKLEGDSLYFDRNHGFASASNNIRVTDTVNNSVLTGHYAEVFKKKDSIIVTKRALVSTLQGEDSLHIHGDTLLITGKKNNRIIRTYHDVRLYGENMSGKCDSLFISEKKGITKMLKNPVLWSGAGQVTGDTIHLINDVETDQLDSLWVFEHAFIIQKDSIKGFNQVKGKRMYGLFKNNELYELNLIQNTETIYYLRNDKDELIGIDKMLSSSIRLLLEDQKITDIYYLNQPDGTIYPKGDLPENAQKLRGFNWRGKERLKTKSDLFVNAPPLYLPKIKGIPLPVDKGAFFEKRETKDAPLLNKKSRLTPEILKSHAPDSTSSAAQKHLPQRPSNTKKSRLEQPFAPLKTKRTSEKKENEN